MSAPACGIYQENVKRGPSSPNQHVEISPTIKKLPTPSPPPPPFKIFFFFVFPYFGQSCFWHKGKKVEADQEGRTKMEKTKPLEQKTMMKKSSDDISKHAVWDCGSSLYDSFELKAFERQLDSAIASRTLSMPHLSDRRQPPPPPPPALNKKPTSKISRSLHRLIRLVFRPKNNNNTNNNATFGAGFIQDQRSREGFYVVYDRSAALSTIPEAPEFDGLSPEIRSLVRRTASDRFSAATSIGIYCA